MIENIKAVNNPLTIIAIFAALAEIAGTIAIKLVAPELQYIFIWFVMIFPILIVVLFFVTLNFNPKVLYAPSDFKDEGNFLHTHGVDKISNNLEGIKRELETAKVQIIEDVIKQIDASSEKKREKLQEVVNHRLAPVQSEVESTKESVQVARKGGIV